LDHSYCTSLKDTTATVIAFQEFITQKNGTSWRHCVGIEAKATDFADVYIHKKNRVGNKLAKSFNEREKWQEDHKHTLFDFVFL